MDNKAKSQIRQKVIKGKKSNKAKTGRPEEWTKNNKIQVRWYLPAELVADLKHYTTVNKVNQQELLIDILSKAISQKRHKGK